MSNPQEPTPILGQSRGMSDDEAEAVQDLITQAQRSSRRRTIPKTDLAPDATTQMRPDVACVMQESHIRELLNYFNRNYLYGQGRFDEYSEGLLLKWGDGYSRKHIWVTVDGDNLVFETSHERNCGFAFCLGHHHIYAPDLWHDIGVINAELAEQFQRPVYERSDD
jgi:hypothetical protein